MTFVASHEELQSAPLHDDLASGAGYVKATRITRFAAIPVLFLCTLWVVSS